MRGGTCTDGEGSVSSYPSACARTFVPPMVDSARKQSIPLSAARSPTRSSEVWFTNSFSCFGYWRVIGERHTQNIPPVRQVRANVGAPCLQALSSLRKGQGERHAAWDFEVLFGGAVAANHSALNAQVSTRILGRRTAPCPPFLIPTRVPRGFTQDPSTDCAPR